MSRQENKPGGLQGRGDAMNEAREAQVQEETASLHGSLEGSAARAGIDQDAQSSVNSILGPALGSLPSPLSPLRPSLLLACQYYCKHFVQWTAV